MKTKAVRLCLVLAVFTTSPYLHSYTGDSPAAGMEDTWHRTLSATGGSENWLPGKTLMTIEFLDRKGDTDQVMRLESTIRKTEDGTVTETKILEEPGGLIGALMPDGAVGADGVTGASTEDESGDGFDSFLNPFLPDVQRSLSLDPTERSESINGVFCEAFLIRWQDQQGAEYDGTIWLDRATAHPVLLEVTTRSTQDFVESMVTTVRYGNTDGPVLPVSVVTTMEFRYALVIRARIRMTIELDRYFDTTTPL